jgi:hypothetical protein
MNNFREIVDLMLSGNWVGPTMVIDVCRDVVLDDNFPWIDSSDVQIEYLQKRYEDKGWVKYRDEVTIDSIIFQLLGYTKVDPPTEEEMREIAENTY